MTIGIYKLSFTDTDRVYIGQSVNIERRYLEHLNLLSRGLSSIKLNEAFLKFGKPILEIIKICSIEELDYLENTLILEYSSHKYGFNTLSESGYRSSSHGADRYNSLADSCTYRCILSMLALTDWKLQDIADEVEVSLSVVKDINRGHTHRYLKEEYPEYYSLIMHKLNNRVSGKSSAKDRGIIYPKVVSPEGVIYEVDNATQFAVDNKINIGNFNSLLNKKRLCHQFF